MDLYERLTQPISAQAKNGIDRNEKLFKLGDEVYKLETKRKLLFEKLGSEVYHQRLESATDIKEEIEKIDRLIEKLIRQINNASSSN